MNVNSKNIVDFFNLFYGDVFTLKNKFVKILRDS